MQVGIEPRTKIGGDIYIGKHLRERLCFLADGTLLVAEAYQEDPQVLSFQQRLRFIDTDFTIRVVGADELEALYSDGTTSVSAAQTTRQQQAVSVLKRAVQLKASDVHLIRVKGATRIKFRVNGDLEDQPTLSHDEGAALQAAIYQSMCEGTENTYKPLRSQDGRLKLEFVESIGLYGARIATRPLPDGQLMAIRLLYDAGNSLRLEDMGYLPQQIRLIQDMIEARQGVAILTGTTGSGKSTTLQVALARVVRHFEHKINIITVEDPPEYRIPGANQSPLVREEGVSEDQSWKRSIKNLMRMDPDIIMVGEMRDKGSATSSFEAALTGHGLWTTLHTKDPVSALQRLIEMGVDAPLVTDPTLLRLVVNQALCRRLCEHCKRPYEAHKHELPPAAVKRIDRVCMTEQTYVIRGSDDPPCSHCRSTGISGRTLVAEVLQPDLSLMHRFRDKGVADARQYWVEKLGGVTRTMHLVNHINAGIVDPVQGEKDINRLDMYIPDDVTCGEDIVRIVGTPEEQLKATERLRDRLGIADAVPEKDDEDDVVVSADELLIEDDNADEGEQHDDGANDDSAEPALQGDAPVEATAAPDATTETSEAAVAGDGSGDVVLPVLTDWVDTDGDNDQSDIPIELPTNHYGEDDGPDRPLDIPDWEDI